MLNALFTFVGTVWVVAFFLAKSVATLAGFCLLAGCALASTEYELRGMVPAFGDTTGADLRVRIVACALLLLWLGA